ncbi:MAG: nucleoside permease [Candidatus Azobacteroides sp.]|nr:nucleoside permease [Candidatus Azobacteroides sp.]
MGLKLRLTLMQFLEFFIWGSWLISFGGYLHYQGVDANAIAFIYAMAGLASVITPGIVGIIADKWLNSERLLGICHLTGAVSLFFASRASSYNELWPWMMLNALVFMPTISLSYSVSYSLLSKAGLDTVKVFPAIRTWGTVGFICAMWIVNFLQWTLSPNQLLLAAASALVLGIYSFTLPPSPPVPSEKKASWKSAFGVDAFVLFKERRIVVFFIFSLLLGICLQITNTWGTPFLNSFASAYPDSFTVKYPLILLSISQISEALFILAIPFFLRRYGIKTVMLMSFGAWTLRFGLFGIGNPGSGFIWLVSSMIVYGMAFDFFNISGSLFIEKEARPEIRSSAQGLFMMASNGLGAVIGQFAAAEVIHHFTNQNEKDWPHIWFTFALYALLIGILYAIFFQYKHKKI